MRWITMLALSSCLTNHLLGGRLFLSQSHYRRLGRCHAWVPREQTRRRFSRLYHSVWKGDMVPFSEYATHVEVAPEDVPVTVESAILRSMETLGASSGRLSSDGTSYVRDESGATATVLIAGDENHAGSPGHDEQIIARQVKDHPPGQPMTSCQLLHLGCVWYLSAEDYQRNEEIRSVDQANSDPIVKPSRLSLSDAPMMLREGDYMRIHHTPRRFPRVYRVDWSLPNSQSQYDLDVISGSTGTNKTDKDALPFVVKQQGPGYCIVDKPPIIPVHSTVDNTIENVAHQLRLALKEQHQQENKAKYTSFDGNSAAPTSSSRNSITSGHTENSALPIAVRQQGPGYCIVDKPPIVPVHATSYNKVENVAHQLQLSLQEQQRQEHMSGNSTETGSPGPSEALDLPYVGPVQRIDVNTSGLLVMATSPEFAAYFSHLLSTKTRAVGKTNATAGTGPTIEKGYKCLVCLQADEHGTESVLQAWKRLTDLQRPKSSPPTIETHESQTNNNTKIIRHFLQSSIRAPKLFVDEIPKDNDGSDDIRWYECLMEITHVGDPVPLYATTDNETSSLEEGLWPRVAVGSSLSRIPPNTKAVVEVQVSLITGRTHQIRGQLSKLGFPIVGDELYGGAVPPSVSEKEQDGAAVASNAVEPQLLALQCCQIGFLEADYKLAWIKKKRREVLQGRPNRDGRWVRASLEKAWWTPFIEEHIVKNGNGFNDIDFRDADNYTPIETKEEDSTADSTVATEEDIRPDLLPPTVQLSPGRNKYVVAKLRDPATQKLRWFVRSAPLPYHAEVAFDLLEWIGVTPGYEQTRVEVTGGGRIDFDPQSSTVSVYGFSYRYGKGDHVRVAELIQKSALGDKVEVTYDLSDKLY